MFFMGAVEFSKTCPPRDSGIQVEVISLKINSKLLFPGVGGAMEYIDWCITNMCLWSTHTGDGGLFTILGWGVVSGGG